MGKLNSKKDWYQYLAYSKGYFLPSYTSTKLSFIKDVLKGEKTLLKSANLRPFNVPSFSELSVANVMNEIKGDKEIMKHLNYYEGGPLPERDFFFGVVGTLAPRYLEKAIQTAMRKRNTKESTNSDLIMVKADLWKKLSSEPFLSKNKGQALSLLKTKSKPIRSKKRSRQERLLSYQEYQSQQS